MIKVFKYVLCFITVAAMVSCGSAEFVPTKDICSVVKHHTDNLYQVRINNQKISSRWYIKNDALDITKMLAAQNKCMK